MTNFIRRAGAYVLDVVIVSLFVSLISFIPLLNPHRVQYSEKYQELQLVQNQYEQSEISAEEYEQAFIPIAYEIYRLGTHYKIIDIVCVILYFVILQYFLEGQTIGKKLFQIRVVNKNDEKASIINLLLRTVVLSNLLISIVLIFIINLKTVDNYFELYNLVNSVGSIITYIILFMCVVKKDGRGLHDYVGNTKVISIIDEDETIEKEQKVLRSEFEAERSTKQIKSTKQKRD